MRVHALILTAAVTLQEPLVPVDVPDHATGRVVVRGDSQFVTRHIDGVFDVATRRRVAGRWQDVQVLFTAPRGIVVFLSSLSPDGRRLYVETNLAHAADKGS